MGFLERAIDFHRGSLVYDLRTCTVNILCALAPSEPHPPPVPNCWKYLLRPSRCGIVLHCKPFCVFGPRAQSEVHYFSLAFTLRPRKLVEYLLYPSRGGDKLDRVSSASWQGVAQQQGLLYTVAIWLLRFLYVFYNDLNWLLQGFHKAFTQLSQGVYKTVQVVSQGFHIFVFLQGFDNVLYKAFTMFWQGIYKVFSMILQGLYKACNCFS